MATNGYTYTDDDLSSWECTKKAFANDWEQTKANFGVDGARDMDQDVDDTLKQAAGSDNAFENREKLSVLSTSPCIVADRNIQRGTTNWMHSCEVNTTVIMKQASLTFAILKATNPRHSKCCM